MFKHPIQNAIGAGAYITLIVLVMQSLSHTTDKPDNLLAPIVFLSMFTLSAAVMGYLFLGTPLQLYLDGHKKEAVHFFAQTVGAFAVIATLAVIGLFLRG